MTSAEIRTLMDQFAEAFGRGDAAALGACYANDCTVISPIFRTLSGRVQVEHSYADLFKAFSQEQVKVADLVVEEPDRAVVLFNLTSLHIGEIFGMPASGKRIERTIAYIMTLHDGRIVKEIRVYDFTSMLMQLGVLRAKPA